MRDGFIDSRATPAAVAPYAIVAFNGTRGQVRQAAADTDPLAGIADSMGSTPGGMADVQLTQIADARAGGTLAAGDRVTADANGRAVKAVKRAGFAVSYIGFAQEPAVADDIFPVLLAPGVIDG